APRRHVSAADGRQSHRAPPAADLAGVDRLELRPAHRDGAVVAASPFGVQWRLDVGGGGGGGGRGGGPGGGSPGLAHQPGGEVVSPLRSARRGGALSAAGDGAPVCAGAAAGSGGGGGRAEPTPGVLRATGGASRAETDGTGAGGVAGSAGE